MWARSCADFQPDCFGISDEATLRVSLSLSFSGWRRVWSWRGNLGYNCKSFECVKKSTNYIDKLPDNLPDNLPAACHKIVSIKIPQLGGRKTRGNIVKLIPFGSLCNYEHIWRMPNFLRLPFFHLRRAFGFAGKLNLRQSMALRIRRVSRVANAPQPNAKATSTNRAGPRLRLRLSLSSRPGSRARPWARSQLRHLAIHYAQLRHPRRQRLRCLRCLQQRAAQRRSLQVGVPLCVCVCAARPTPLSDTWAAPARLLSFRAWQQRGCFICTWRIHQSGFYITWYFRCLFRFIFVSVFFFCFLTFLFFLHFLLVFALLFAAAPNNTIWLTIFSHLFAFFLLSQNFSHLWACLGLFANEIINIQNTFKIPSFCSVIRF